MFEFETALAGPPRPPGTRAGPIGQLPGGAPSQPRLVARPKAHGLAVALPAPHDVEHHGFVTGVGVGVFITYIHAHIHTCIHTGIQNRTEQAFFFLFMKAVALMIAACFQLVRFLEARQTDHSPQPTN